jgi:hypothetical protein
MIEPSKNFTFKGKAITLAFIWVNYFLESKKIVLDALVPHQVNGTEAAFAKQILYDIAIADNTSCRENSLYFLHAAPRTQKLGSERNESYPASSVQALHTIIVQQKFVLASS